MTNPYADVGVILAAGGRAERFGMPKLWLDLKGRPVFAHSLELFLKFIPSTQVILTIPSGEFERYQDDIEKHYPDRVIPLVVGGATRSETVRKGLAALPPNVRFVAIHDAARPLLTEEVFTDAVALCREKNAGVVVCAAQTDTVKRVRPDGTVAETLPREELVSVQTPQVFPLTLLLDAYQKVSETATFTDDAAVCEAVGYPVYALRSDAPNLKITHAHDWYAVRAIRDSFDLI